MTDDISALKAAVAAQYQIVRQLNEDGRHDEARTAMDAAAAYHLQAARRLLAAGHDHAARDSYLALIGAGRHLADALHDLGVIAFRQRDYDKAEAYFGAAHALDPALLTALTNLAATYKAKSDFPRCLDASDKALRADPDNAAAHACRGAALYGLHRYDEALAEFSATLRAAPDDAQALANCALALKALDRVDEALPFYERALGIDPNDAQINFNYATALLKTGDYARGFARYEWRWEGFLKDGKLKTDKPLWTGAEPVGGRTIVLHQEQGLGDAIQFSRYVPLVAARGARVMLQVDAALAPLMAQLVGPSGTVLPKGAPLPDFDLHCPLMSLPLAFGTTVDTVPAAGGYLVADPDRVDAWARMLGPRASGPHTKPRIGIAWSGRAAYSVDALRSIPLAAFAQLDAARYDIVSLQREVRAGDAAELAARGYTHFGERLRDFGDTAALITAMDLVVTVDTSVAHLAGALGKDTWILLSTDADWRWLRGRTDSPWYRSVRLFRQRRQGDWSSVFDEVRAALHARAEA